MVIRKLEPKKEDRMIRAAAYIRTSTKSDSQEESFEIQSLAFKEMIETDPTLSFSGIYGDRKSGTSDRRRPGFRKMCADAEEHRFERIYVKSISRFSRNIGITMKTVDRFRELGIVIIFENEHLRSDDLTCNFTLSLIAAVSQNESHSISRNVAMGYHERFKRGVYNIGNHRVLGYDCNGGKLVPNGDAWIIREIFARYVAGESPAAIARTLNSTGARTLRGGQFTPQGIRYILHNETYVGDKHLQKCQPRDYLTHQQDPSAHAPDYYLTNDHEAIIGRDAWDAAQRMMSKK